MQTLRNFFNYSIVMTWFFLLCGGYATAKTIIIDGQKIINKPTTYSNVTLDMHKGSFLIINNATLKLVNTKVYGALTTANPRLFHVDMGYLYFKNNRFFITASTLPPVPTTPPFYSTIKLLRGNVFITGNKFTIDTPYVASLFYTDRLPTSGFTIAYNSIHNFHGGLLLTNSNHANVSYNKFSNVSLSNIFTKNGNNNSYKHNQILYSGNNGIDIIDSNNITFSQNYISLSSCYSIFILRSQNVLIEKNKVIGGITYAVTIVPSIGVTDIYAKQLATLVDKENPSADAFTNKNIQIIDNYFSQNRFGIATVDVDGLNVKNNIFIQKFNDDKTREFWTNNTILLQKTINITWENNLYKEAFSQDIDGDNDKAFKFVNYPTNGGVIF